MSDKQEMIKKMLEMQKKFIEEEHKNSFDAKNYFHPEAGHALDGFRQTFRDKSMELVDAAHADKGSKR